MLNQSIDPEVKYTADGRAYRWPITFPFNNASDIGVKVISDTGVEKVLAYGTDYTIDGQYVVALVASGSTIDIWSTVSLTVPVDDRFAPPPGAMFGYGAGPRGAHPTPSVPPPPMGDPFADRHLGVLSNEVLNLRKQLEEGLAIERARESDFQVQRLIQQGNLEIDAIKTQSRSSLQESLQTLETTTSSYTDSLNQVGTALTTTAREVATSAAASQRSAQDTINALDAKATEVQAQLTASENFAVQAESFSLQAKQYSEAAATSASDLAVAVESARGYAVDSKNVNQAVTLDKAAIEGMRQDVAAMQVDVTAKLEDATTQAGVATTKAEESAASAQASSASAQAASECQDTTNELLEQARVQASSLLNQATSQALAASQSAAASANSASESERQAANARSSASAAHEAAAATAADEAQVKASRAHIESLETAFVELANNTSTASRTAASRAAEASASAEAAAQSEANAKTQADLAQSRALKAYDYREAAKLSEHIATEAASEAARIQTVALASTQAAQANREEVAADLLEVRRIGGNVQILANRASDAATSAEASAVAARDAAATATAQSTSANTSATQAATSANNAYKHSKTARDDKYEIASMKDAVATDKEAVATDRAFIESLTSDAHQAVLDVAAASITEDIKDLANDGLSARYAVIAMTEQFAVLSDRVTRLELGLDPRSNDQPAVDPTESDDINDRNNPNSDEYFADLFSYTFQNGANP